MTFHTFLTPIAGNVRSSFWLLGVWRAPARRTVVARHADPPHDRTGKDAQCERLLPCAGGMAEAARRKAMIGALVGAPGTACEDGLERAILAPDVIVEDDERLASARARRMKAVMMASLGERLFRYGAEA